MSWIPPRLSANRILLEFQISISSACFSIAHALYSRRTIATLNRKKRPPFWTWNFPPPLQYSFSFVKKKKNQDSSVVVVVVVFFFCIHSPKEKKVVKQPRESNDLHRMPSILFFLFECVFSSVPYPPRAHLLIFLGRRLFFMLQDEVLFFFFLVLNSSAASSAENTQRKTLMK